MISPPRDYPEQQEHKPASAVETSIDEADPITVRAVLDRLDSEQPVTDAMIHKAVTNLHVTDTLKNSKGVNSSLAQSLKFKNLSCVPESLLALLKRTPRN